MAGITLKVTPEELKSKAQQIQGQIERFEAAWNNVVQIVGSSRGYWQGDAGNVHQKQFRLYQEDVEKVVRRLKEHPVDLLKMAGVYEESERRVQEKIRELSGDVIS